MRLLGWSATWPGTADFWFMAKSAKIPNGASYGELRLDPVWDSLRGKPRFEKLVASLAPKEVTPN